ncbi:MAG: transcription antitermination factor NusB [Paenibacillus sp. RIFOXYA1_FULL_44_5]|nr:MAG: transcription antitermination factor NusB [Paenibacillus sp. RIFOXYA1_FULL_44_5]
MKRRNAREIALQSLYQMEMNEVTRDEAIQTSIEELMEDNEGNLQVGKGEFSTAYIHELVQGVHENQAEIDERLLQFLKGWKMDRLSRVDKQILRLAVYEMLYRDDVPPKVVINEAIELAKHFGSEESGKFVNGVLGKMHAEILNIELKSE